MLRRPAGSQADRVGCDGRLVCGMGSAHFKIIRFISLSYIHFSFVFLYIHIYVQYICISISFVVFCRHTFFYNYSSVCMCDYMCNFIKWFLQLCLSWVQTVLTVVFGYPSDHLSDVFSCMLHSHSSLLLSLITANQIISLNVCIRVCQPKWRQACLLYVASSAVYSASSQSLVYVSVTARRAVKDSKKIYVRICV